MRRPNQATKHGFWWIGCGRGAFTRESARIDLWLRDIAPSDGLRKRFHGKPENWETFCAACFAELDDAAAHDAAATLLGLLGKGQVTLLYAARDEARNNAVALKAWLERRLERGQAS